MFTFDMRCHDFEPEALLALVPSPRLSLENVLGWSFPRVFMPADASSKLVQDADDPKNSRESETTKAIHLLQPFCAP